eukprot:CAMPEP_0181183640 /NCGR_PEP_ID=MMETSP1096-20121128/8533_1 /TAXON_ID=156174 ORGANISM="Chrysochromulina ericina, Strain CCMP281" /NCGR_SAMPLE_ID=MMETSP1096 /ASSEMBLY_ACC=CAM_ASM_000453 /LENGTH=143 /DNA_ID=CAMNT_0023272333 /DNA_START=294 /DNA_END=725 /DNA_ORIENTATION=-
MEAVVTRAALERRQLVRGVVDDRVADGTFRCSVGWGRRREPRLEQRAQACREAGGGPYRVGARLHRDEIGSGKLPLTEAAGCGGSSVAAHTAQNELNPLVAWRQQCHPVNGRHRALLAHESDRGRNCEECLLGGGVGGRERGL